MLDQTNAKMKTESWSIFVPNICSHIFGLTGWRLLTFVFVGTQWNSRVHTKGGILSTGQMGLLKCIKGLEEKERSYTMVQTNPQRISFPCVSSVYVCTCIPKMCAWVCISKSIKNQGTGFTRNITQVLFEVTSWFKENISSYPVFCSGLSKIKNILMLIMYVQIVKVFFNVRHFCWPIS